MDESKEGAKAPILSEINQKIVLDIQEEIEYLKSINSHPIKIKMNVVIWHVLGEGGSPRPKELFGIPVVWLQGNSVLRWIIE